MASTIPTATIVNATAARWAIKNPELTERLHRAVALVANVTQGCLPHVFFVEGSNGHQYIVRIDRLARTSTCTCPDHAKGNHCKHRLAVALVEAAKA